MSCLLRFSSIVILALAISYIHCNSESRESTNDGQIQVNIIFTGCLHGYVKECG